jgi:hypothetical protein
VVLEHKKAEHLTWRMQLGGFALGLVLATHLLAGTFALLYLANDLPPDHQTPRIFTVLLWAATAGFVGGAGRAMFRFIWEVGAQVMRVPRLRFQLP